MSPPAFSEVIEASEVPVSQDHYPSITGLNSSYFREGENFGDFVASPTVAAPAEDVIHGEYLTPQQMLPRATMDLQGQRHTENGDIPNEGNIISVDLSKNKHTDCSLIFNLGLDEGVSGPVNDIWRHVDDHYKNYSLVTGTEYDTASRFDKAGRRLELAFV